jgi:hypothetical protein
MVRYAPPRYPPPHFLQVPPFAFSEVAPPRSLTFAPPYALGRTHPYDYPLIRHPPRPMPMPPMCGHVGAKKNHTYFWAMAC